MIRPVMSLIRFEVAASESIFPSFSRGNKVCTYASREELIACSGEMSMSCERPVGLVAQAERVNRTKRVHRVFIVESMQITGLVIIEYQEFDQYDPNR